MAEDFENIVFDRVMKCPFVPGAKEFLERNHQKYDLYIASGTPDEEMNRIVDGRGLREFFKGIYGTPLKKTEIISYILNDHAYKREEVIFVGDAGTDKNAASEMGLMFIGRNTSENSEVFSDVKYKVDSIMDIENIIEEINRA